MSKRPFLEGDIRHLSCQTRERGNFRHRDIVILCCESLPVFAKALWMTDSAEAMKLGEHEVYLVIRPIRSLAVTVL